MTTKNLSESIVSSLKTAKKGLMMSILALSTLSIMAYAGQQASAGSTDSQQSGIGGVAGKVEPVYPRMTQAEREAKLLEIIARADYTLPNTMGVCQDGYSTLINIGSFTEGNNSTQVRYLICQSVSPGPNEFVGGTPLYSDEGLRHELSVLGYSLPAPDLVNCLPNYRRIIINDTSGDAVSAHFVCQSNDTTTPIEPRTEALILQKVAESGYALPNLLNECTQNGSILVSSPTVGFTFCKQVTSETTPQEIQSWMLGEISKLGYVLPNPIAFSCPKGYTSVVVNDTLRQGSDAAHIICENNSITPKELTDSAVLDIVIEAGYSLPGIDGQCGPGRELYNVISPLTGKIEGSHVLCRNSRGSQPSESTTFRMVHELAAYGYLLPNPAGTCDDEGYSPTVIFDNRSSANHYLCKAD